MDRGAYKAGIWFVSIFAICSGGVLVGGILAGEIMLALLSVPLAYFAVDWLTVMVDDAYDEENRPTIREKEKVEEERDRLQRFINTAIDSDQPTEQVHFTLEEENEHYTLFNDEPKTLTRMIVADSGLNSPTEESE